VLSVTDPLETMPSDVEASREPTTKACRTCASNIPVAAILSKECKSYQDWRGWLSISQVGLALAVALVSVVGSTVPTLIDLFTAKNSKLSLNFAGAAGGQVLLAVANPGNRAGTILTGELPVKLGHPAPGIDQSLEVSLIMKGDRSIPPGTNRIIPFSTDWSLAVLKKETLDAANHYAGKCEVQFQTVEFDGTRNELTKDVRCVDVLSGLFPDADVSDFDPVLARWNRSRPAKIE
jgi:hypothetical protein